ncbi:MAG: hypothetical protein R3Y68_10530 [Rikenellaceae bacterium]
MKIVRTKHFPFGKFTAINICGVYFVKGDGAISDRTLRHEAIHTAQMKEMLYIGFYIWYFVEWLWEVCAPPYDEAYHDISFEEEAYDHEDDPDYLTNRMRYAWVRYIFKT